jgi:hypothetical protein
MAEPKSVADLLGQSPEDVEDLDAFLRDLYAVEARASQTHSKEVEEASKQRRMDQGETEAAPRKRKVSASDYLARTIANCIPTIA